MPIETTDLAPQSNAADLETRDMLLNIGPAHPAMHGIIRIVTKLDGERIQEAEVEIGYLRGSKRYGAGRLHGFSLNDQGPRISLGPRGEGDRRAHDHQLLPRGWSEGGPPYGFRRIVPESLRGNPQGPRRIGWTSHAQPDFCGSHERYGIDQCRGRHRLRDYRPLSPRDRRRLRRTQGLPIRCLRPADLCCAGRHTRGQ